MIIVPLQFLREIVHVEARLRPCEAPLCRRRCKYCAIVYIKELLKCIGVFQHCRFSQDEGRGGRNSGSGASSCHSLLMPVDNRIQHSKQCDTPFLSPAP